MGIAAHGLTSFILLRWLLGKSKKDVRIFLLREKKKREEKVFVVFSKPDENKR